MTEDVRSDPGDLAPGDHIAGYRIQERIGRGGMAVVYLALDLRLSRPVALKVLAPDLGEDEAFRQRFMRESRAAAGVDHPHIIPVFEAGESADVLFIAMRYVSGGDLRSLIEAEVRLSPERTAVIASQAGAALDAAHARGLVHRDVKPGNILLGQASSPGVDHVYLSDFGLSKHSLTPSTLTSTGQFLGTLDYVSPEQIQGHPVDGRADQYALACAVVEMLTGRPPFLRDDTMALMWAQLEATPPRLTERRPELPPAVDQVVARALAKSPSARYPTCRDFAAALTAACAAIPDRAGPATALADPVRDSRQVSGWPADSWPTATGMIHDGAQLAAPDRAVRRAAGPSEPVPQRFAPVEPELARNFLTPGTPAGTSWPSQPPLSAGAGNHNNTRGTWPLRAGQASPPRGRPARHTGRTATVVILVAVFILGVAGAVAYRLAHRERAGTPLPAATVTTTVPATVLGPEATVHAYFAAINHHRYRVAWQLRGEKEPYATFAAGFAGTAYDTVKIVSVSGNVVTMRLVATQTDGTAKTYEGTYTVTNGVISATDVHRLS